MCSWIGRPFMRASQLFTVRNRNSVSNAASPTGALPPSRPSTARGSTADIERNANGNDPRNAPQAAQDTGLPSGLRLGDLEALQGVVKFPVRIKCATLAWNTLQQGLDEIDA